MAEEAPAHLEPDGIWCQRLEPGAGAAGAPGAPGARAAGGASPRPALFLDRDGVLVEEVGYLHRPEEVRLLPGAAALVAAANAAGIPVVVLTNQSGIGRGLYGWAEFAATQARIQAELAAAGAHPDLVLACPFHPDGKPPYRHPRHPCRKPRPGMLLRAAERLGLDLERSWIVGDRADDLEAGRAAGLRGGLHVLGGHGAAERAAARALAGPDFAVRLGATAAAAGALIPELRAGPDPGRQT